jgi:hypothetical protein
MQAHQRVRVRVQPHVITQSGIKSLTSREFTLLLPGKLRTPLALLDQPAFGRNQLKAEKLTEFKLFEQIASTWTRAESMRPAQLNAASTA